jgi:hypothetical protein
MPPRKTPTPKVPSKLPAVHDYKFKELLQAIERAGGRHKLSKGGITLKSICDANKTIFGQAGSAERRGLQKRFDKCSRRSIEDYITILQEYQVTPSEGTSLLYRQELLGGIESEEKTTTTTDDEEDDEEDDEDEEEEDDDEEEEDDDEETTTQFDNLNLTNYPPIPPVNQPTSVFPSVVPSPAQIPTPAQIRTPTRASPSLAMPAFDIDDLLTTVNQAFTSNKKNGNKKRPHCVPADILRPENNTPFEIHHVDGLVCDNGAYSHPGFAISIIVPPADHAEWEAMVVDVPGFENRAVLITVVFLVDIIFETLTWSMNISKCVHIQQLELQSRRTI